MEAIKKALLLLIILLSTARIHAKADSHATAADISKFKQTWLASALKLQREIDINAPLNEATFIGTHNSYNSKAYQTKFRYFDPNQNLSIYNQLEMGVRSIELDAHWFITNHLKKKILLCHAKNSHLGCSIFDRPFIEGLAELRDWLKAHPNEIVLLYIERHLNGHEAKLAGQLNEYVGQYIFKTERIKKNKEHSCIALPTQLTKADVLAAGKQLIIVTKGCAQFKSTSKEQKRNPYWNDYVFAGIGDIKSHPFTFIDATITHFKNYPDCSKSDIFNPDSDHQSLWRIFEDRTLFAKVTRPEKYLREDDMRELMHCRINWPALDKLKIDDKRLYAAIWSWADGYPEAGLGKCAVYKDGQGIQNTDCKYLMPGFACQEENTHDIKAVRFAETWTNGESTCRHALGTKWHFIVPVNGEQMGRLKESMRASFMAEIWLNYAMDAQGKWRANQTFIKANG